MATERAGRSSSAAKVTKRNGRRWVRVSRSPRWPSEAHGETSGRRADSLHPNRERTTHAFPRANAWTRCNAIRSTETLGPIEMLMATRRHGVQRSASTKMRTLERPGLNAYTMDYTLACPPEMRKVEPDAARLQNTEVAAASGTNGAREGAARIREQAT